MKSRLAGSSISKIKMARKLPGRCPGDAISPRDYAQQGRCSSRLLGGFDAQQMALRATAMMTRFLSLAAYHRHQRRPRPRSAGFMTFRLDDIGARIIARQRAEIAAHSSAFSESPAYNVFMPLVRLLCRDDDTADCHHSVDCRRYGFFPLIAGLVILRHSGRSLNQSSSMNNFGRPCVSRSDGLVF